MSDASTPAALAVVAFKAALSWSDGGADAVKAKLTATETVPNDVGAIVGNDVGVIVGNGDGLGDGNGEG